MSKGSGGTRNYSGNSKVMNERRTEYNTKLSTGRYDASRSYMSPSGGFVLTHNGHNKVENHDIDKSDIAVIHLADKGYKVYLDDERSSIVKMKMPDGRVYNSRMEIKTINSASDNTIHGNLKNAVRQIVDYENKTGNKTSHHTVVLYQNTGDMDEKYVRGQIQRFKDYAPQWTKRNLDVVIVVGSNGHVHRHFIHK